MIFVLDFGSQYSHLITRRIRELGVFSELVPPDISIEQLKKADGIILSGGPQNLSEKNALRVNKKIFDLHVPLLGICYGLQLIAYENGGQVKRGKKREYGPAEIKIKKNDELFKNLNKKQKTWMSHGDRVSKLPKSYICLASSKNCSNAAIKHKNKPIYGLQFHPEVAHTEKGNKILENFINMTDADKTWQMEDFIKTTVKQIKQTVKPGGKAICALSGGVDSAVAASLVHKAIGENLICIYVDTGLMRKNETARIEKAFKNHMNLNLKIINAEKNFLKKLKNITNPEKKRKIIGREFIKIFENEAKKIPSSSSSPLRESSEASAKDGAGEDKGEGEIKYLVQGTLYTDAITSGESKGKTADTIKSHHNVGGLPEKMNLQLIEPLRELYKDEVREIGRLLDLPETIYKRQPFPGPGLAVRIIGTITRKKLQILREADAIVRKEIENAAQTRGERPPEQYFAVLPDIKSVGVQGDSRSYGYPIIVRAVETKDFMTADWAKIPQKTLENISIRITNEISEINRVVYDITPKPPGTVEWE